MCFQSDRAVRNRFVYSIFELLCVSNNEIDLPGSTKTDVITMINALSALVNQADTFYLDCYFCIQLYLGLHYFLRINDRAYMHIHTYTI